MHLNMRVQTLTRTLPVDPGIMGVSGLLLVYTAMIVPVQVPPAPLL